MLSTSYPTPTPSLLGEPTTKSYVVEYMGTGNIMGRWSSPLRALLTELDTTKRGSGVSCDGVRHPDADWYPRGISFLQGIWCAPCRRRACYPWTRLESDR